ncbi:hypothetical protein Tola_0755 [Tolumonas auensis DSM 9187]|uniref:Uncharacterized protein n=1 Tax=Tolumonas auensis (strain DSM 9187 / NBRC 110442 / TA 4) TaxID=595494 RepID=C4LBE8_TOLAT|nr:carboxypeptidase-like regulatory domain-containing protein [Tolumonas auensis]ACQ92383.1 hypothetical protein Tola_0755 [Tolumonas auensis DSM 9187]
MSYEYLDSFNDAPSIVTTTICEFSNNASVVFSQSLGAVTITSPTSQTIAWIFTGLPIADNSYVMTFEADIELVSDPMNLKHTGIFIVTNGEGLYGLRFAHLYSGWQVMEFSGMSSQVVRSFTQLSNPSFNVGERRRVKCIKTADNYKFYVNDSLVADITNASYRLSLPGIFSHQGSINVHSISYQIDGLNIYSKSLPMRLTFANGETKDKAWPGENSCKQLDSQTAEKAYGVTTAAMLNSPPLRKDFGFIEGVITRKTAPAVGQHVICLDDRFNLVAETLSGSSGYYRFDSLPINGLYAIHAYDNNEYKYAPVGADRRTPEAYP